MIAGGYGSVGAMIAPRILDVFPGSRVVIGGRSLEKANAVVDTLEQKYPGRASAATLDMTSKESLEAAHEFDVLVNCVYNESIEVLKGTVLACKQRGAGYIDLVGPKGGAEPGMSQFADEIGVCKRPVLVAGGHMPGSVAPLGMYAAKELLPVKATDSVCFLGVNYTGETGRHLVELFMKTARGDVLNHYDCYIYEDGERVMTREGDTDYDAEVTLVGKEPIGKQGLIGQTFPAQIGPPPPECQIMIDELGLKNYGLFGVDFSHETSGRLMTAYYQLGQAVGRNEDADKVSELKRKVQDAYEAQYQHFGPVGFTQVEASGVDAEGVRQTVKVMLADPGEGYGYTATAILAGLVQMQTMPGGKPQRFGNALDPEQFVATCKELGSRVHVERTSGDDE